MGSLSRIVFSTVVIGKFSFFDLIWLGGAQIRQVKMMRDLIEFIETHFPHANHVRELNLKLEPAIQSRHFKEASSSTLDFVTCDSRRLALDWSTLKMRTPLCYMNWRRSHVFSGEGSKHIHSDSLSVGSMQTTHTYTHKHRERTRPSYGGSA